MHEIVTVGDYMPGSGSALWTPWVMFRITWQQWEEQLHIETLPWDAITHTHTHSMNKISSYLTAPNHHGTHTTRTGIIWNVFCTVQWFCVQRYGSLAGLTLVHTYSCVYSKLTSTNSTHTLLVEITQHCTNDSHTKVSWTDHVLLNFDLDYSVSIG